MESSEGVFVLLTLILSSNSGSHLKLLVYNVMQFYRPLIFLLARCI